MARRIRSHPSVLEIHGVGIDAVDLEHFARTLEAHPEFTRLVFTRREFSRYRLSPQSLAARFAVKEAFIKAAGARAGTRFREIETLSDSRGQPYVILHGRAQRLSRRLGIIRVLVTMSHSRKVAVAQVILLARRDPAEAWRRGA